MIYLDNGATTWPKPLSVKKAMLHALDVCGNPGRGGHMAGKAADKILYNARVEIAELFGMTEEAQVVFTSNATQALNIAIKSVVKPGGHVVISGYEHNSVLRPVAAISGVSYTVAESQLFDTQGAFDTITQSITPETSCVIVNHISNVFGNVMPIKGIDEFCFSLGVPLIIDASQSAGNVLLDVSKLKSAAFVCMPGHKSLYGPSGTGVLLCLKEGYAAPLVEGGTGSRSSDIAQPDFLPDMLESGTPNFVGIAGLLEGVRFVKKQGIATIESHKRILVKQAYDGLSELGKLEVFYNASQRGLLSFTLRAGNDALFEGLCKKGLCLRGGLHCSPLSHQSAKTVDYGTIRVSFSCFNTKNDVNSLIYAVKEMLKNT